MCLAFFGVHSSDFPKRNPWKPTIRWSYNAWWPGLMQLHSPDLNGIAGYPGFKISWKRLNNVRYDQIPKQWGSEKVSDHDNHFFVLTCWPILRDFILRLPVSKTRIFGQSQLCGFLPRSNMGWCKRWMHRDVSGMHIYIYTYAIVCTIYQLSW